MLTHLYNKTPTFKYKMVVNTINFFQSNTSVQKDLNKNKYPVASYDIYKSSLKDKIKSIHLVENFDIYHIAKLTSKPTVIFYLHGGGYVLGCMKIHYEFLNKVVEELNVQILMPDYPLSPQYTYQKTVAVVERAYLNLIEQYPDHDVVFMGDSAGGGLAIGLYHKLRQDHQPLPKKIIAISPCLDVALNNPEILAYLKTEPILKDLQGMQKIGQIYGEGNMTHPWVSPYYGDFTDIDNLSVFIGTNDILYPDCERLRQKMLEQNSSANFFVYENMCHCWMIYNSFEESQHAFEHLRNLINC